MNEAMNKLKHNTVFLLFYLFSFFFFSCGVDGDKFRLEGRLRNINHGEFWLYSTDGVIDGIDTIQVREGRFAYETELRTPATMVLIFPNYSEQPIFAEPGKKVTIKGNASQMKEMDVSGTDDNEAMTGLRMNLNKLMPPEIPKAVETFIRENPKSIVSSYLLQRYFLTVANADYQKAYELVKLMIKEQPDNVRLVNWKKQLEGVKNSQRNMRLPDFTAVDVKGRSFSGDVLKAKVNVVTVWASWNFQSIDMQRRLQKSKERYGDQLAVVSICLDASPKDCKQRLTRDSVKWMTVCDGNMWHTPLVNKLGLTEVPGNIVADNRGIIIDNNLSPQRLEEKIDQLLR